MKRVLFVDYYKALLMILVVMGHINYANSGIKEWIYSFHMPAFFFISGMMISFPIPETRFVLTKYVDRLVVPFFLWALIFAKFSFPNALGIAYASYNSISRAGALTSLWFLPVMFIAILFLYLLERCFKDKCSYRVEIGVIVTAFVVGFIIPPIKYGYPWSINVAIIAFGFMLMGRVLKSVVFRLEKMFASKGKNGLFICGFTALVFLAATFIYRYNIPEKGFILMGNARFGNPFIFVLSSVLGVLFILLLSIFISLLINGRELTPLSFIGQNTLCIFAVQKPIIQLFGYVFRFVQMPSLIGLIVVTVCTLAISCMCGVFFNKYLPVVVGKGKVFHGVKSQVGNRAY